MCNCLVISGLCRFASVIEATSEIERQRKRTRTPAQWSRSVLLQYAVDTLLDQTLQRLFEVSLRDSNTVFVSPRCRGFTHALPRHRTYAPRASERQPSPRCHSSGQGCGTVFYSLETS